MVILIFALPMLVLAVDEPSDKIPSIRNNVDILGKGANYALVEKGQEIYKFAQIIGQVINVFFSMVGVIFLILMVYAGYLWMMAQGNEEQVTKAKALIRSSIIGLIIAVSAYAITWFIFSAFSTYNLNLSDFTT